MSVKIDINRIKNEMESLKINPTTLANMTDIPPAIIMRLLSGDKVITVRIYKMILEALSLPVIYIRYYFISYTCLDLVNNERIFNDDTFAIDTTVIGRRLIKRSDLVKAIQSQKGLVHISIIGLNEIEKEDYISYRS